MNTLKLPFDYFSNYVLRTPILSFDFYKEITAQDVVTTDALRKVYSNPLVREACFLASPMLYFEMEKWMSGELDPKKEGKLSLTLLKYVTRMSTRCTPFGLFAGCNLGLIKNKTEILNAASDKNGRHTRLDMDYLVALSQDLSKREEIRRQLRYFPNTSIYSSGNQLRYIEYYYLGSRRKHRVVEVDNSIYLQNILTKASTGAYIDEFINLLNQDGIPNHDAESFIEELLENQILVSELEPSVSGPEFTSQILKTLKNLKRTKNEIDFLDKIDLQIQDLDQDFSNHPLKYLDLSERLKELPTSFDLKFLFQCDLVLQPVKNELSSKIPESIKKGIILMNKLTEVSQEHNLSKFKEAFRERYEDREMPLSQVLDIETGIGYLQGSDSGDINPLVDDIVLPDDGDLYTTNKFKKNGVFKILEEKLISCDRNGDKKLILRDNDFRDFPLNWDDFPDTLSTLIEVIDCKGQEKIKFTSFGGSSAAKMLARFCYGEIALNEFVQSITNIEKQMNADKILAEIVHLPEARVGNVLMRPSFREYEISYLAKSNLDQKNQIPLEDLFISLRNDRIFLRSKRLNKEIVPRLTNAHNFSFNALPIYQFLCDLQTQGLRERFGFDFGFLGRNRAFLPRVEYENLILHEAKWKIKKRDVENMLTSIGDVEALKKEVLQWRKSIQLPQFVLLNDGDNELLINLMNITSVQMLLDTVKNRPEFQLSEFLFEDGGVVQSEDGYFTNQIILSFYNREKLDSQKRMANG